MKLPDGRTETAALRNKACCHAEPECLLCPLRPENADQSLQELWDRGLYANLRSLGFK